MWRLLDLEVFSLICCRRAVTPEPRSMTWLHARLAPSASGAAHDSYSSDSMIALEHAHAAMCLHSGPCILLPHIRKTATLHRDWYDKCTLA